MKRGDGRGVKKKERRPNQKGDLGQIRGAGEGGGGNPAGRVPKGADGDNGRPFAPKWRTLEKHHRFQNQDYGGEKFLLG